MMNGNNKQTEEALDKFYNGFFKEASLQDKLQVISILRKDFEDQLQRDLERNEEEGHKLREIEQDYQNGR